MNGSQYQDSYFHELTELKTHALYLELLQERDEKARNCLNFMMQLFSSGSLASLAIVKTNSYALIVFTILVNIAAVIKRVWPFEKRARALYKALPKIEALVIYAEKNWYKVCEGVLNTEDIHNLKCDIKNRKVEIFSAYLPDIIIPSNKTGLLKGG